MDGPSPSHSLRPFARFPPRIDIIRPAGEMAERSKALDWKSSNIARCSWVRIPLSPPLNTMMNGAYGPVFRLGGAGQGCGLT